MYMESSSPAKSGDRAQMESKKFPPTRGRTLTFYYNMYGANVNYLRVFLNTTRGQIQLWKLRGDQGQQWKKASVHYSTTLPCTVSHLYAILRHN